MDTIISRPSWLWSYKYDISHITYHIYHISHIIYHISYIISYYIIYFIHEFSGFSITLPPERQSSPQTGPLTPLIATSIHWDLSLMGVFHMNGGWDFSPYWTHIKTHMKPFFWSQIIPYKSTFEKLPQQRPCFFGHLTHLTIKNGTDIHQSSTGAPTASRAPWSAALGWSTTRSRPRAEPGPRGQGDFFVIGAGEISEESGKTLEMI